MSAIAGGGAPPRSPRNRAIVRAWAAPAAVFLLALGVFSQYGFRGQLSRDEAVLMYAGQRLADGVPPYVSTVTLKGPLAQVAAGAGVALSRLAGWDDLRTVRGLFLVASAATAALLARLGEIVWGSRRAGIFAALILLAAGRYGDAAASGPDYKTVMLLFLVLALLMTVEKRWLGAGAAGALSFLVWQPSAVAAAVTLLLAAAERTGRSRALALAAAGVALPLLAASAWFAAAGSFREFALRVFLVDLPYLEREPVTLLRRLLQPLWMVRRGFGTWMLVATGLALAVFARHALRRGARLGWREALLGGRSAAIGLTLALFCAWSFYDFQGAVDFFPLLPGVALGCAAGLDGAIGAAAGARAAGAWAAAGVAGLLLLLALGTARSWRDGRLTAQRREAAALARRYGAGYRLVSIGQPQPLVLLRRTNPNPYLFIEHGTDALIARRSPGGFAGWLRGLERGGPLVVLGGVMRGRHAPELRRWLAAGFRTERIGSLRLRVREAGP